MSAIVKTLPLQSDSFTWMLPCDSMYLTGLQFEENVPEQVHRKVFSSQDGVSWHLAADSGKCKIEAKTSLRRSRPPYLVKWLESAFQNFELEPQWFKLEVLEGGFYNSLHLFLGMIFALHLPSLLSSSFLRPEGLKRLTCRHLGHG